MPFFASSFADHVPQPSKFGHPGIYVENGIARTGV
jgi:hypothetical protein